MIEGASTIDTEHFQKNHLPNISIQLSQFGFPTLKCVVEHKDELAKQQAEYFQIQNEKIFQEANKEALRAMASLQQEMPPIEEESNYRNFSKRKNPTNQKLGRLSVTPMIDVDTEENRIVFEGLVFDLEQKLTRTGRVLIQFKMTDYTSSFPMQKWLKNEEEAKKFDMIKKGSWLRVRGNIEMNNFTRDLTMNVQDVEKAVHLERKDLMPDDEKRIEFHAHTNMSTMDALPEVEEIVHTAAKWGHKAVAITDHANVQSFPHGYKAAV